MIDAGHRCPAVGDVAVFADIGGLNMAAGFTGRGLTIVTARAIAGHRRVIEPGTRPSAGDMAIITIVAALDMVAGPTGRGLAIVAARTSTECCRMIDPRHRFPTTGIVTVLANIRGADMVR